MNVNPNTSNHTYIHGDFDRDGTPNIDDQKPFTKRTRKTVSKFVLLSETFDRIDEKRRAAAKAGRAFKRSHKTYTTRVKDPYSIIDKWGRSYHIHVPNKKKVIRAPYETNDLLGVRKITKWRRQARKEYEKFNAHQKGVYEKRDYYRNPHGRGTMYRGFHTNFFLSKIPTEAQFKTTWMQRRMDDDPKAKKLYKKYGNNGKPYREYMERKRPLWQEALDIGY